MNITSHLRFFCGSCVRARGPDKGSAGLSGTIRGEEELSITEIRTIKSKKGVSWSCRNCNILSSDINDLKAAILSLRNDLAAREKSAGIDDKAFEELLAELGDRNNRKQNIIMFGVPESDTHDANTRRSRELETVQAVLKALPSGMNTDHIEVAPRRPVDLKPEGCISKVCVCTFAAIMACVLIDEFAIERGNRPPGGV
ncbi:hypothetical protein Trydic_g9202 [Trypoxylus dichotomus]